MDAPTSLDDSLRPSGLWLVAFKGYPGSGQSTLARAVSRRLGWPLIDKDDVCPDDTLWRQRIEARQDSHSGRARRAGTLAPHVQILR